MYFDGKLEKKETERFMVDSYSQTNNQIFILVIGYAT